MEDTISKITKDVNAFYGIEPYIDELPYVHENNNELNGRKIYYISDLHVEFKDKKGYIDFTYEKYIDHVVAKMNGGDPFGDDPLLIVGDISCFMWQVDYFFKQLRMRRDGNIIFVLGNHDIWAYDKLENRELYCIIEEYRNICTKYDIELLHNELAFFFDERTGNGELLPYFKKIIISENDLISMGTEELRQYSKKAKLIIYGGIGFSGVCKICSKKGILYNAEMGLYRDIVPTLEEDIKESIKCENAYKKVLEALNDTQVIILTHCPFDNWTNIEYNPNFIYLNGHTHHDYFERTAERTIFADNQVGYSDDCYDLRYFIIEGTYDAFKDYKDGIYQITYEQYIDFNIGKNIRLKKKRDDKQIYMLKGSGYYMFVYYNSSKKLVLLNGGSSKRLGHNIDYYYENLGKYGTQLNAIMEKYTSALNSVSYSIKKIGGSGNIHGCIVDIDYYNHIYINPIDGRVIPYYAIDMTEKYVYTDLYTLIEDKSPSLLPGYIKWKNSEQNSFMLVPSSFELSNSEILVTDRSMYKASRVIKTIQYLLFQNIIRDWNDKVLKSFETHSEELYEEINKIQIDEKIFKLTTEKTP